jgi:hypothetical protein
MKMAQRLQLSRTEWEYLKSAPFLSASLKQIVETAEIARDETRSLIASRDEAEELRSAFTDRLAEVGFDADNELTAEGGLLEELIDRFYSGEGT